MANGNGNGYYSKEMLIKSFPVRAGKLICILNQSDAREFGVFAGDRMELANKKNGKKCVAFLDISSEFISENHIGLFDDVLKKLGAKGKEVITVKPTAPLKSLDFIKKKMMGETLSAEELAEIVKDIAEERLSDVEASAFISAVYMKGFDLDETIAMTKALIAQGTTINFSKGPIVDKHSVGGVNGRATMVIVPIVAANGLLMPKTSSRSITSAAGTADAMEVLCSVDLSMKEVQEQTEKIGAVISWGGAVDLAPADDKIIKLEHPLSLDPEGQVIASVLAKKASVGSKFVVIDLPVGQYVKIKDKETAMRMAKKFVQVGKEVGMEVESIITNGDEPSGPAFGPALEARHAMETLEGKRFDNLAQKSCELAGALFELVGYSKPGQGYYCALETLKSGRALEKMKEIIKAQGGKILRSEDIPVSNMCKKIVATEDAVIDDINTREVTKIARLAGCPADALAGVMLNKMEGDKVKTGEVLFTICSQNEQKLTNAATYAETKNPYSFKRIILSTIR